MSVPTMGLVVSALACLFSHTFLVTFVGLLVVAIGLVIVDFLKTPKNGPPLESGIPYLGVVHKFPADPIGYTTKMYEKHGEIFTLKIMGQRLTFLVGPEAHEPFMRKNDEELDQNEPYQFCVPIFGPGVVYDAPTATRNQQLKFVR